MLHKQAVKSIIIIIGLIGARNNVFIQKSQELDQTSFILKGEEIKSNISWIWSVSGGEVLISSFL